MPLSNDKKGQANWQTWGMDTLGPALGAGASKAPVSPQQAAKNEQIQRQDAEFRHLSEIKALRERVKEAAHQEGYATGYEAAREEGYAKGLEEGRLAGENEMREKTKLALEPIRHLALGFSTALNSLDAEMGEQIAQIALKIGQQLALDAIKASPEAIVGLVGSVLHSDPEMIGKPRLRANPEDTAMIAEAFGDELAALGWKLIPDTQISRGGCKVISTNGEIDATWETRWASIQQEFQREKAE